MHGKIAAGQGFTGLTKCIEPGATGDQNGLIPGARIENAFDIFFPLRFFVDFIQNQQVTLEWPGLIVELLIIPASAMLSKFRYCGDLNSRMSSLASQVLPICRGPVTPKDEIIRLLTNIIPSENDQ